MRVAVAGGGLAAATLATELRERGFDGEIVIFSEEAQLPYERPDLSKGFLNGEKPLEKLLVHDEAWYRENSVDLRKQQRVTKIDVEQHTLQAGGADHSWDKLVLATGASPRVLPEAAKSGRPTFYLRNIEHSEELRKQFAAKPDVAIVGGGWIGLEVAAAAVKAGCKVTSYVLEELPLVHIMGEKIARAFLELHQEHGVEFKLSHGAQADELATHDIVVCGIGAEPRTSLAMRAGLAVDHGVLVDSALRTSNRDVYAIGDIANQEHPLLGRLRVEHWDNAIQQGRHVAANIVDGPTPYERQPYFYSDQYDLGMEYFGHATGEATADPKIEGDLKGAFRAWWLDGDGKVLAAMQANDWDASDELRASVGKPLS